MLWCRPLHANGFQELASASARSLPGSERRVTGSVRRRARRQGGRRRCAPGRGQQRRLQAEQPHVPQGFVEVIFGEEALLIGELEFN